MISLAGYAPEELNLPTKFREFRPAQIEAIEHGLNSTARFVPMALPVGSGKSLIAMGIARASGLRTVILTATKGLMLQYETDFNSSNLVGIKGRANYTCAYWPNLNCRYGQLEGCPLSNEGCTYESYRDCARQMPLLISNYAYWFHVNEHPPGLDDPPKFDYEGKPVQQLILDEVHQAGAELSKYLQTQVKESWLKSAGLNHKGIQQFEIAGWREFALNNVVDVGRQISNATKRLKLSRDSRHLRDRVYELDALKTALSAISVMDADNWVLEAQEGTRYGRQWTFDNIWPAAHNFKLFRQVPKIILMSGTLRPATMTMLGIRPDQYDFREWPRVFPAAHTPIYHIPTVKMNHKIGEEGLETWVRRIDEIIESRLDRKGIIHTVSYARQRYLLDHSRFAQYFYANTNDPESESAAEVVARFREATAPAILVSPSFGTGWDFAGRAAEFIIVAKVPYPDIRSKIIQARSARNPSYASQLAMQELEQSCGRASRSFSDRCEVMIVDDAINDLMFRHPGLKSRWFTIIESRHVPPPGPRCPIS